MKIFIDADACPVIKETEEVAAKYAVPVVLLCDTNHVLHSDYSEVKVIGAEADAVDFALVNCCQAGDLVVTQDYGVAAMALGRKAYAIHPNGWQYTNENIERLLMERHLAKKARGASGKHHLKGPRKRSEEDNLQFKEKLERLLTKLLKQAGVLRVEAEAEPDNTAKQTEEWHELTAGELPKLMADKLEPFGFAFDRDAYFYAEDLLAGSFSLQVKVSKDGVVSTLLLDIESEEPYVLHLVENAQGAFVGEVRTAYQAVLNRIGEACGEHGSFHGAYVEELLRYVQNTYGDEIEYPWKDTDAAVIRSHLTRKWYAVFMKVHPSKIGLGGSQPIRIMNLHGTAEQVAALVDGERYFPGWHMNRKYWYTICLDGSIPMMELQQRIDESLALAQSKKRR